MAAETPIVFGTEVEAGWSNLGSSFYSALGYNIKFGFDNGSPDTQWVGHITFTLAAAQGTEFTKAYLWFLRDTANANGQTLTITCYGIDEDDSEPPNSAAEVSTDCGLHTTAKAVLSGFYTTDIDDNDAPDGYHHIRFDVTDIVNEILARPDWSSGNNIQFHVEYEGEEGDLGTDAIQETNLSQGYASRGWPILFCIPDGCDEPYVADTMFSQDNLGNSSKTVHMPEDVEAGDTLLVIAAAEDDHTTGDGLTLPAGWTRMKQIDYGTTYSMAAWWKKAAGTEGGTDVTLTLVNNGGFTAITYAVRNAYDPEVTAPGVSTGGTASTSSPDTDSVTATVEGVNLVIPAICCRTISSANNPLVSVLPAEWRTGDDNMPHAWFRGTESTSYGMHLYTAPYLADGSSFDPSAFTSTKTAWFGYFTICLAAAVSDTTITEIETTTEIYVDPDWVDISAYVRSWTIQWGAGGGLEQIRARTFQAVLSNSDRRFEPAYSSGANYPAIKPGTQVRFGVTTTTAAGQTYYRLFYGVAESWAPQYRGLKDHICILRAVDPIKILAGERFTGNISSQLSHLWMGDACTDVEWSVGVADSFETGDITLQAVTDVDESVLSLLNKAVDSEQGWLYLKPESGAGMWSLIFLNRYYLPLNYGTGTIYYLDDEGTNGQYRDLVIGSDDDRMFTRVTVTIVGGTAQTFEYDAISAEIGERSTSKSGLLMTTDAEALTLAERIAYARCRPLNRLTARECTALLHVGKDNTTHTENVAGLWWPMGKVRISWTPPGAVTAETFDCRVIGGTIRQKQAGAPIEITGRLMDASESDETAGILGDSDLGKLGSMVLG